MAITKKNLAFVALTSLFICLNYFKIIFLNPSNLNEPSLKFPDKELFALLETLVEVFPPSIFKYIEKDF